MRGQDCKRTHSAQGNAGYIYEAKRREIKEIETMRGARVCRGFDFRRNVLRIMPVDDFGFVIVYKLKYIMRYRQYLDILYPKI